MRLLIHESNYSTSLGGHPTLMTRGDQRERDRAKNLKKQQQEKKGSSVPEGMTILQKKEMYIILFA